LQRSRKYYADLLSVSKRSISNFLDFLESEGYISVLTKNLKIKGKFYNNVQFLKPEFDKILEITNVSNENNRAETNTPLERDFNTPLERDFNREGKNNENDINSAGIKGEKPLPLERGFNTPLERGFNTNTSIKTLNKYKTNKTKEKRKK